MADNVPPPQANASYSSDADDGGGFEGFISSTEGLVLIIFLFTAAVCVVCNYFLWKRMMIEDEKEWGTDKTKNLKLEVIEYDATLGDENKDLIHGRLV